MGHPEHQIKERPRAVWTAPQTGTAIQAAARRTIWKAQSGVQRLKFASSLDGRLDGHQKTGGQPRGKCQMLDQCSSGSPWARIEGSRKRRDSRKNGRPGSRSNPVSKLQPDGPQTRTLQCGPSAADQHMTHSNADFGPEQALEHLGHGDAPRACSVVAEAQGPALDQPLHFASAARPRKGGRSGFSRPEPSPPQSLLSREVKRSDGAAKSRAKAIRGEPKRSPRLSHVSQDASFTSGGTLPALDPQKDIEKKK